MADSNVEITEGSGTNIDTRTETNGQHRQVVVLGDPSVTDSVAVVQASDPDSNAEGVVVRDPNSTAVVSGLRDVRVQSIVDGTVSVGSIDTVTRVDRVHNLVDGTISTVTAVTGITDTVAVHFDGSTPTIQVGNKSSGNVAAVQSSFSDGESNSQNALNVHAHLQHYNGSTWDRTRGSSGYSDGALRVVHATDVGTSVKLLDSANTEIGDVGRVRNIIDGTLSTVTGITNTVSISAPDGTFAVYFSPATPAVNVEQFGGGDAVTPNTGIPVVNTGSTMGIFTVAGSTSGGTTSGVTLISPSANYNFKIFAFSLTTTAQTGNTWAFANGSGASQTKFWQVGLQAPSQGVAGANLSVAPPGYLFATGTSTTLVLYSDSGSLVHYSVSYIKESA